MRIKNYISRKIIVIIAIVLVVVMAASFSSHPVPPVTVGKPVSDCALTAAEFNSWFNSSSVSLNGEVKPYISGDFPKPSHSPS
ncbi:MAG: hypothetical protein ACT4OJ_11060, partial [Bacteroidota bacterium]